MQNGNGNGASKLLEFERVGTVHIVTTPKNGLPSVRKTVDGGEEECEVMGLTHNGTEHIFFVRKPGSTKVEQIGFRELVGFKFPTPAQ